MAEGSGKEESSRSFSRFLSQRKMSSSSEEEDNPPKVASEPDLGISPKSLKSDKGKTGNSQTAG